MADTSVTGAPSSATLSAVNSPAAPAPTTTIPIGGYRTSRASDLAAPRRLDGARDPGPSRAARPPRRARADGRGGEVVRVGRGRRAGGHTRAARARAPVLARRLHRVAD